MPVCCGRTGAGEAAARSSPPTLEERFDSDADDGLAISGESGKAAVLMLEEIRELGPDTPTCSLMSLNPAPVTSAMLPVDEIVRTAVREHPDTARAPNTRRVLDAAQDVLGQGPLRTPVYHPRNTPQLSVCRFRCMLQDTGYPLEVYLPPAQAGDAEEDSAGGNGENMDWSRLKERWVGWAVEVPGEQTWIKQHLDAIPTNPSSDQVITAQLESMDLTNHELPPSLPSSSSGQLPSTVHGKWPLPGSGGNYSGALVKIYDPNISFRPGTAYEFIGILSQSRLPASSDDFLPPSLVQDDDDDTQEDILVPAIHVLTEPYEVYPMTEALLAGGGGPENAVNPAQREEVIDYLADLLPRDGTSKPDRTAAEILLLALISRVTSKAPGSVPLGTLTLDLLLPRHGGSTSEDTAFRRLVSGIKQVMPLVVDVELSLQLLSEHAFFPVSSHVEASASTGDSLQAGLLQLAPGTVVIINEDTLQGGGLQDKGVRNLKALADTVRTQKLRYEFPFVSEEFGMETDLAFLVMGQGKSLLPSRAASSRLEIPTNVAEFIQAEFIRLRKEGLGVDAKGDAIPVGEVDLRNWMRMGRLLALTYPEATFGRDVWTRVLELDLERKTRLAAR
ncbi:hypothetical protein QFC19_001290 [Naganishia cerealis]|uniref:Uncharacterized protein n=1 Tax=Naganishia cerealis TaxID=610337 RepID=A0ACC2WKL5_9TREE|nr:hypothetical protein QFC19_001290 [Naganishia cerealis]